MQKSFRILRISSVRDYSHSSPCHPKCLFSQTEQTRIEQNPFGIFGSVRLEIILIAAHVIPTQECGEGGDLWAESQQGL